MMIRSLILLLLVFACAKKGEYFTINGTIEHYESGFAKLLRLNLADNSVIKVDSVPVKNGRFYIEGSVQQAYLHALYFGDKTHKIDFFIENAEIEIHADFNDLTSLRISGSREETVFRPWYKKQFQFDADRKVMTKYRDFHSAPFVAFYHFQSFPTAIDTMKKIIDAFDASLHDSPYYKELLIFYEKSKRLKIGQAAPDFSLPDSAGRIFSLSEFKGKTVFLDFWASWCVPCREANDSLVQLFPKLDRNQVEFISVSIDSKRKSWLKAVKKDQLKWMQLSDLKAWDSSIAKKYNIKAIPQSFLIDKEGKIIAKNVEAKDFRELFKEFMNDVYLP